jgi:hypothetical protein
VPAFEPVSNGSKRRTTDFGLVRADRFLRDLLRQRAEALKAFDDRLTKLGYKSRDGKPKRSHHKHPEPDPAVSPKSKPKAQRRSSRGKKIPANAGFHPFYVNHPLGAVLRIKVKGWL